MLMWSIAVAILSAMAPQIGQYTSCLRCLRSIKKRQIGWQVPPIRGDQLGRHERVPGASEQPIGYGRGLGVGDERAGARVRPDEGRRAYVDRHTRPDGVAFAP